MQAKILYLAAWYPHRYDPMPGLFIQRYADLVSKFHKIAILNIVPVEGLSNKFEVEPVIEGDILVIRVYYRKVLSDFPILGPLIRIIRSLIAYKKGLKALVQKFGIPQLVHINVLTIRLGFITFFLKNRYKIPYVITEHSSNFLPEKKVQISIFRKFLLQLITRKSAGTSAVSEALKNGMISYGINHKYFKVIRNVVPNEFFNCEFAQPNSGQKIISNITCFDDAVKNISGLVRTIEQLLQKRNDFFVYLVGDGPDKQKIEVLVQQLGLNHIIKLTGLLEYSELVKAYQRSSFTVLFSNYETMSVVIAESLSCGKPVIATHAGGMPELVTTENGLLAEPGNESDLLNKIDLMLDTYYKYDSNKLRYFAFQHFSEDVIRDQFLSFYKDALS
jgi:glycosyltransferase involved in cell wall biosynthesis